MRRRIAVLGGGPIGLEAALHGAALGHDVRVYEQGRVGEHVRRWAHVRLFSSWQLERSALGVRELERAGAAVAADGDYPTGADYVARYLEPLARSPLLAGRIEEQTRVAAVGRERIGKRDPSGGARERHPFRLLLDGASGERLAQADQVLDCTGTYGNPGWLGSGNLPALGERQLDGAIVRFLEDFAGTARSRYAGRRVLVVGAGHSAATALEALLSLDGTTIVWVARQATTAPYTVQADDPLPERSRLGRLGNELARGDEPRVTFRGATVVEEVLRGRGGAGFAVHLRSEGSDETLEVEVDCIVSLVGYRPDNMLYRELQVHECYASGGPMRLAAALLETGSADCLAVPAQGAETLVNPEPGFFILGAKSYGTRSNFLIRTGLEQVREVYTLTEGRPDPDP